MANTGFYPLLFLAATPFFLSQLGDATFGTWMLINTLVIIVVQVSHFGMGQSITMFVAESRGKGKSKLINGFYNNGLNFSVLVAIATALLAVVIWFIFPLLIRVFNLEHEVNLQDARIAFSLAFLLMGLRVMEQFFQGFYKGFEEFDTASKFNMSAKTLTLVVQAAAAYAGFGLSGIMLATLLINAVFIIWQRFHIRKYLLEYAWKPTIQAVFLKRLSTYGFWAWLQTLLAMASSQLDRFAVIFFFGPAVLAYYSLASMIANHIHMMLEAPIGWSFPKISRYKQQGRDPIALYYTMRAFIVTTAVISLVAFFLVRQPILTLWLGAEKYSSIVPLLELFLIYELFQVLTVAPKFFMNGMARMPLITGLEAFYRLLSVALMFAAYAVYETPESLIWGQIIALIVAAPVEAFVMNAQFLRAHALIETFGTALPSLFAMAALLSDQWMLCLMYLLASLLSLFAVYFRNRQFQLTLLLE